MVNIYITYRKRVTSDNPVYLVEDKWVFNYLLKSSNDLK